ncbi:hypothetical protein ACKKBG_A33260 [Auxenochlorella protothecoides x Auxenochlorella symbiontica]|uniref:WD repeat-containing protein 82 n=2 Tax=Auxenochlorella protothecoides TaxID=3075 RepID=A0A087SJ67_AUXPR|nr:WD repeat-containing protein 82 [Auxenochlorella protothecoides]KFM25771.1 WD repeat-containing protein 82 [Auxenochlorella protothecoides]RMZ57180.1 hypothetical protein APUTEX25_004014 [Auxenochlorella protothecoides]|eukprot:RMZ57180.1 hypothetical protein APUTEX25_004014 [Auxenochlorella protothecoides]
MEITPEVLSSFGIGKVFKESTDRINSLDFHRTHDLLVTGGDDDAIRLYDTETGTALQALLSKKYGVKSVCFTHDPSSVIYSSNKGADYALRYHDLHSNRYVRYFRGHGAKVTTLCMSPKSDNFLSAAEDKQVRLWDLRQPHCQAMLQTPGLPTVAYDEQGLVFCVGAESGVVKLYDARNYGQGPFAAFTVADEKNGAAVFAVLRFSLDGKYLLAVVEGRIYVMDAFEGTVERKVHSNIPEGGTALEACLTADGKYVLSGCADRAVRAWSVADGSVVSEWKGHAGVPTCLKWSPRKMLVASACQALALWIPAV